MLLLAGAVLKLQIRGVLVTEMLGDWDSGDTGDTTADVGTGMLVSTLVLTVEAGVLLEMEACPSLERNRQQHHRKSKEDRLLRSEIQLHQES